MHLVLFAASIAVIFLLLQWLTLAVTFGRCRHEQAPLVPDAELPPISLVRPLCGIESHGHETLATSFALDYPRYEVLFCVADAADPVIALVRHAMAAHPGVTSRLLIGEDAISVNPKLNNMAKGWHGACHDRIAFVDSNVLIPPDFLRRLIATWRDDTGVVSAPPIGTRPIGFWSHVECAFLNSYEARWQFAADAVGMGFAQGKTLFVRRSQFEVVGIAALAAEPAEDAATTKAVRRLGLRARLGPTSPQPLGRRTAREVWARQLRWARLRRVTFPLEFAPEVVTGCAVPALAAAAAAFDLGSSVAMAVALYLVAWFVPELALCRCCRWPVTAATPLALLLRDLLIPLLWVGALAGTGFSWRGTDMQAGQRLAAKAADL